ncbi:MAG: hypothetical protein JJU16_02335 [Alkalibacterium sp.]|nr:hypothetical protein [Alkalibacterium sp.]
MNKKWIKLSSVALLSLYLAACDTNNDDETAEEEVSEVFEEEEDADSYLDEEAEESEEEETETEEEADTAEESDSHEEFDDADAEAEESIIIEGMGEHYHTGELVELTAVPSEDTEYDDWHWYTRADENAEWEMISGQNSNEYIGEAPEETIEMRVVLYDDSHEAYAQSEPIELEVDNH